MFTIIFDIIHEITSKEFSKKIQANFGLLRINFKLCHFKSTTFSSMPNIMILEIGNSSSLTIPVIQGMS